MKKEFVTKQDLGIAYFPLIDAVSARQKLSYLIHSDSILFHRLLRIGYKKSSKYFSPNKIELIYERLGKPF